MYLQILTGANDKSIKMWNVSQRQFLNSFLGHNNWVRSVKFSEDGEFIISCSDDKTVRVWDTRTMECVHVFRTSKGLLLFYLNNIKKELKTGNHVALAII